MLKIRYVTCWYLVFRLGMLTLKVYVSVNKMTTYVYQKQLY